ncbi:hypothetical protein IscW_ISCW013983 [Ixodes scapularis]|uniref:Uncharacterized protein n=1 Tax=Ixodes scapularis TaxID=6945 RepID=B7QLV6_IXOSC|nr:hypothetical protein IscW_ISCW013983 [Ixodes scapularis]|eukprot:XP_002416161.1 hypothetical protein IscW_ISCW013983 [Ixodes scapularis]
MDLECHEEAPMVVINHHVGTESQGGSVALSEEVRRLLESSDPDRPTVVLVQSPPSPLPWAGDVVAPPVEAGSPPGGRPDHMRFRCSSIWVGSHKSAAGRYWVTVTGAGFEFPMRTVYSEWREVSLSLGVADVTEVLGHLSCDMAVLYVTTTPECACSLREKLGTSHNVPHYFDPGSTGKFLAGGARALLRRTLCRSLLASVFLWTNERYQRIAFLPDPALTNQQKYFLQRIFPARLLKEIDQKSALKILAMSASGTPPLPSTPCSPMRLSPQVPPLFRPPLMVPLQGFVTPASPSLVVLRSQLQPASAPCATGGAAPSANPEGPGEAVESMVFGCRTIRVGSHQLAGRHRWVTATKAGFEFTLHTVRNEWEEVNLRLGVRDMTEVLGYLSRNMPVLYVRTTHECGCFLREMLGMSPGMPRYFDSCGTNERHKWITFLPDPALTDEQKRFLRMVFPAALMVEIDQRTANKILVESSLIATDSLPPARLSVAVPRPWLPPVSTSVAVCPPHTVCSARAAPSGQPWGLPGGRSDGMRFRCYSIRVGSRQLATGDHWVTVTEGGFQFSLLTAQNEEVSLSRTDVTRVLGHLADKMPVLHVTTTPECGRHLGDKLGAWCNVACPSDYKWYEKITFLPDPALTDEQKGFLRTVFPADLLAEIDQTSALGIITNSSLAPMVTSRLLLVPLVCRERAFEDSSVGKLRARLSIKMLPSLR